MKSFSARLAALEALEAAQRPESPPYACLHAADYAALNDLATPAAVRAAIADAYQMSGTQKMYVALCMCDPPESCRVCADQPVISEVNIKD